MITVPFYEMIDETSEIWDIINKDKFPHLYPPDVLPEEIIENINDYFYERQIAYSSPERFLRQWWRLVKERAYAWTKLLETEKVLRDEDMLFNYDLTERSTDNRTGSGKSDSTTTPNLTTYNTPDLLNVTNNLISNESNTSVKGKEDSAQNQNIHDMETPDGITTDIDNYLTHAQKDSTTGKIENENKTKTVNSGNDQTIYRQTGETTTRQIGESKTESESESTDRNEHELRRFGNIGTMTVANVLGGYREAQTYDVFSSVIFPECENLFLHYVDLYDIDIW